MLTLGSCKQACTALAKSHHCPSNFTKTELDYGSYINRAQYLRGNRLAASLVEELLTSFNSFVTKMKEMTSRGNDKGLGDWLDNQDVCQMLNISPRTLQTLRDNGTLAYSQINRKVYYKHEDVAMRRYVKRLRKKSWKFPCSKKCVVE